MSATLNIVHEDDLYPHTKGAACPCGPVIRRWMDDERDYLWKVVVHNAWDGREDREHGIYTPLVPYVPRTEVM